MEKKTKCYKVTKIYIYTYVCIHVPDEGNLLPRYRDCTTSNGIELYFMCCGVMLFLLIIYVYIDLNALHQ